MMPAAGAATPISVVLVASGNGAVVRDEPRSFVVEAARSLSVAGGHHEVEIVVVHHVDMQGDAVSALLELPGLDLVLVPTERRLPVAAALNLGALRASGQHLVFVDERTEVRAPDSLAHLSAALGEPGRGMAGPKVLADDGTIHHAGSHFTKRRLMHPWRGLPDDEVSSPELFVDRDVDVLDPACVALDRETFQTVGGWSEEVPAGLTHVDLAMKVRREGLTTRWSHASVLWTFAPPAAPPARWEIDFVRRRWGRILVGGTA
jgi:GT2 family glycosyltransferase